MLLSSEKMVLATEKMLLAAIKTGIPGERRF